MAQLLYGGGLRLMECVRLRVRDLDFSRRLIYIRAAKGGKQRATLFPKKIHADMLKQIELVKVLHDEDFKLGYGRVYMPPALSRNYKNADLELDWQYVFPAKKLSVDPRSKVLRRHHVLESGLQKAVKTAKNRAGIHKPISCHTFRHYAEFRTMPSGTILSLILNNSSLVNSA